MNTQRNMNYRVYIYSFIFPVFLLSLIFALGKIYPFGNNLVLLTDSYHQYVHFYSYFLDTFNGNDSLLYSWNAGLGSNFIGNVSYYTSSPLLLLLFLFPKQYLTEGVLVLILLKIGLGGLSISYFIKNKFITLKSYEIILFSSFYALMSYNVSYFYNVMWMDGIILLPLIVLSIDTILYRKNIIPYSVLLTLLIVSNFYIAYMIGLYVFLYFLISLIQQRKLISIKETRIIFLKFVGATFLAIGISAFLTVPTFFQLLASFGPSIGSIVEKNNSLSPGFILKLFNGVYDSVMVGTPNIYIGTFVFILSPFFFLSSSIQRSEKVKWGLLSSILFVSFLVPPLDALWHAGDSPNGFPYRYSFLLSFTLLYISLAAYENMNTVKTRSLLLNILSTIILLIIGNYISELEVHLIVNIIVILLFTLFLYYKKYKPNGLVTLLLTFYVITELFFNSSMVYVGLTHELGSPNRTQYTKYEEYSLVINELKKRDDTLYYRIETDLNQTNNDSLRLGHSSFGHSSSMISNELITTLGSLGQYARKANYNKKGGTILTNSLLGLKYFISSTEINEDNYKLNSKMNDLYIYENTNYLPIGFPLKNEIKDLDLNNRVNNPFETQNMLYQEIYLNNDTLFHSISPLKVEYLNGTIQELEYGKIIKRTNHEKPIIVKYYFKFNSDTRLYAFFDFIKRLHPTIYINDKKVDKYNNLDFIGIFDIGKFSNETVLLEMQFDEEKVEFEKSEVFYVLDSKNFSTHVKHIDTNAFTITELKENHMSAEVRMKNDNELLFLSIPWDEGWRVTVDDKKVEPIKILGTFIGIPIEKGKHELQMSFIPKGLIIGSIVSSLTLITALLFIALGNSKKRKRGMKK